MTAHGSQLSHATCASILCLACRGPVQPSAAGVATCAVVCGGCRLKSASPRVLVEHSISDIRSSPRASTVHCFVLSVHVGPMVGPHRLRRTVPTRSRYLARLARKLARLLSKARSKATRGNGKAGTQCTNRTRSMSNSPYSKCSKSFTKSARERPPLALRCVRRTCNVSSVGGIPYKP